MAFRNYLEGEDDKPYFHLNSLAHYYEEMQRYAALIKEMTGYIKDYGDELGLTKEEIDQRVTAYILQNKAQLDQRLGEWDEKLQQFDGSVTDLLAEWVEDGTLTHIIDTTLIDEKIQPLTALLAETATKAEVDIKVSKIVSGSPKATYPTLSALQTALPSGATGVYLVSGNGNWYYWNGTAWAVGGVYQSTGIAEGSITVKELGILKSVPGGINLFNKADKNFILNRFVNNTGGTSSSTTSSASGFIPVTPGQLYKTNATSGSYDLVVFFRADLSFISTGSVFSFTPPAGAEFVRANMLTPEIDTFMVYKNTAVTPAFEPYVEKYIMDNSINLAAENLPKMPTTTSEKIKQYSRLHSISDAVARWRNGEKFPIAFMGDSTTDGATVTGYTANVVGIDEDEPNAYPKLLQSKLREYTNNQTLRIYNAGFSGKNTNWALNNISDVFINNPIYSDVKMIGFMFGINDRGMTVEGFKENLRLLILWCYEKGIQPFLITPQTIVQQYSTDQKQSSNYLTSQIVRSIKDIANDFNIELIDNNTATQNFLANSKTLRSAVLADDLHFTDRGHVFEAEHFFSKFVGEFIEADSPLYVGVTNPKIRMGYFGGMVSQDAATFKRFINLNNTWAVDTLILTAYVFNSSNKQLNFSLDADEAVNFYYKIDGVQYTGNVTTALEIGAHVVQVYITTGSNRRYFGFNMN